MSIEKATDLVGQRKQKIEEFRREGINPFPNNFKVSHTIAEIQANRDQIAQGDDQSALFTTAGRVMAANSFGKSAFIRLRDRSGQLQAYIRKDKVGDDDYAIFKIMSRTYLNMFAIWFWIKILM